MVCFKGMRLRSGEISSPFKGSALQSLQHLNVHLWVSETNTNLRDLGVVGVMVWKTMKMKFSGTKCNQIPYKVSMNC